MLSNLFVYLLLLVHLAIFASTVALITLPEDASVRRIIIRCLVIAGAILTILLTGVIVSSYISALRMSTIS